MFVRELQEGASVDCVLLVREAELRTKRDGGHYLRLTLGDRTGTLPANVWDDVAAIAQVATLGAAVRVCGRLQCSARYGAELKLRSVCVAEPGSFDEADLIDGPPRSAAQMEIDLRELLGTVQDRDLRRLLDEIFGPESTVWARYRVAPGAKRFHHAYRHGLLEHSLGVAQAVSAISATFGGLDRDVAVAGALVHDIGKLDAYAFQGAGIEMTDAGKLQGEIPLGYYRVRRLIDAIEGFDARTAEAVLHIILSHHGSL
ncbi:MAG: 3'-5' exoribonuclease YhaM family protein, partial [Solirubrobacteraceae bacterium]